MSHLFFSMDHWNLREYIRRIGEILIVEPLENFPVMIVPEHFGLTSETEGIRDLMRHLAGIYSDAGWTITYGHVRGLGYGIAFRFPVQIKLSSG
jgi:hypothetical protein